MRTNPLLQPSETGKARPGEKQGPSAAAAAQQGCCPKVSAQYLSLVVEQSPWPQVKQSLFHDFSTDRVFGVKSPSNPEGARDGESTHRARLVSVHRRPPKLAGA